MFWLLLALIFACAVCSWLSPDSGLARSAARAFDSSVLLLSRFSDDEEEEETLRAARNTARHRNASKPLDVPALSHAPPPAPTKRRRITPFVAKKVAAFHKWRCAACGELLTEDFEIDHHIPLHNGGSDDIANLRPLHKKCHLFKNSLEQRRS